MNTKEAQRQATGQTEEMNIHTERFTTHQRKRQPPRQTKRQATKHTQQITHSETNKQPNPKNGTNTETRQ